jgi:hypothetical protein
VEASVKDWSIVICSGRSFIGLRERSGAPNGSPMPLRLSPVYELARQIMQGPGGQVAIANTVMPVLLLGGVTRIDFPDDAIVIPFEMLSKGERDVMMQGVESAEKMRSQMRAAESGIVMAGPGVKLPPPAGRQ